MSLNNGIAGSAGSWIAPGRSTGTQGPSATGQTPGAQSNADSLSARFGNVFQSSFQRNLAAVFDRGAAGEFESPELRLKEQAAMANLERLKQELLTQGASGATGLGQPAVVVGGGGALAAPRPTPRDAAPVTPVTPGTVATLGKAADAAREVYDVRISQSEARLANISQSLKRDFPKAASLQSASTGTWDPTTFVPRNPAEAEAFGQRMVIDATEAGARLEIVATHLDAARFEAESTGSPAATALVARLEAELDLQQAYVLKLAAIVDEASGGEVSAAGADALAGATLRAAADLPPEELAAALREAGLDEAEINAVVGAAELAVEQEVTPGGSPRLQQMAVAVADVALERMYAKLGKLRQDGVQATEERRLERQRDERRLHESQAEQEQVEAGAAERSAVRQAEFEAWLAVMQQASDSQQGRSA